MNSAFESTPTDRINQVFQHMSSSYSSTMAARPFEGKLAIVTGASQGIGEAIVTHLARKGCNVCINYWPPPCKDDALRLAAKLASEHSVRTHTVEADMGTPTGPESLVQATKDFFSSPVSNGAGHGEAPKFQIDILINNAGVALNGSLAELEIDRLCNYFEKSYLINVRGPMLLTKAVAPYLPTDRSGRIVSMSSVSSSQGFIKQSIYGGTKAAVEAMTRTWARELAERATVNCVNPGPVLTRMYYEGNDLEVQEAFRPFFENTPLAKVREGIDDAKLIEKAKNEAGGGRPGYPYEIANMIGLLCSEEASWCTGQVVCANGGMVMLH